MNIPGKDFHHKVRPESKKMTGIPRSLRDNIGGENQEPIQNQIFEEKREIPEDLICTICKGIFKDAVMIPCCGSSFCDECVRTALLESEENECPDCKEKGTSPGSLIPNRFLRNAVAAFHAESSNALGRDKPSSKIKENCCFYVNLLNDSFFLEEPEELVAEEKEEAPPVDEDIREEMQDNSEEFLNFHHEEDVPEEGENEEESLKNATADKGISKLSLLIIQNSQTNRF